MQGKGRNNPEYFAERPNAPGGVANGITSGWDDERDITFLPVAAGQGSRRTAGGGPNSGSPTAPG